MVVSICSHQHHQKILLTALFKGRFMQSLISLLGDLHR